MNLYSKCERLYLEIFYKEVNFSRDPETLTEGLCSVIDELVYEYRKLPMLLSITLSQLIIFKL